VRAVITRDLPKDPKGFRPLLGVKETIKDVHDLEKRSSAKTFGIFDVICCDVTIKKPSVLICVDP
jgi:hypothetical protein